MRLKSNKDVALMAAGATCLACAVVAPVIMLLYPKEAWAWELGLSLSLTVILTMSIATYIGRKIVENEMLTQELQRLVERDRLTNAATRDFFFQQLEEQPENFGVSLMVDIDHFKAINDTHGHLVGDKVIAGVATVLRDTVRSEDIVCRFGGEEFVVFLHDHSAMDAYAVAERMRKRIAQNVIENNDVDVSVTVSIGGSTRAQIADIEMAIKQADDALYQAKQAGRNMTVFQRDAMPATARLA